MLPTIETKYEDSVMNLSDSLKESESYIKSIQEELEKGNQLSVESKILFKSILSKLDQASEMSNMDKLKSIFDNGYIKDTINEKVKDDKERELLLESFSSLRLAILKSTSFTSILTGVLRKSIGSIVGLYSSTMDLPPIVTFMATRLGDMFGSFLQRRKDKKERKAALEEKINRESQIIEKENNNSDSLYSKNEKIPLEDETYDKLNNIGKDFIEGFRSGISEELDTVLKSSDVSNILKVVQHQDYLIESINNELGNYLQSNKEILFKPENVNDSIESRDNNRKLLNLLSGINDSNKNKIDKNKEEPKSLFDKLIPFIISGFGALLSDLGKTLFSIGDKLTFGLLGLLKDISVSAIGKLGPSIIAGLTNPGVLSALTVAAASIATKYMEDINEKLRKAGLPAIEEGNALNGDAINPEDVLNKEGQEELNKFQKENNFSKMSIKDQGALAWYRLTGNEDKVDEILKKYSVPTMNENERDNLLEEQSNRAKETYKKIERITQTNDNSLNLLDNNYNILLEENKKIEESKNNTSKSLGGTSVVAPTNISAPQTNINNINTVNNSSIFQRTTLLTDPGIHYALGASFR